MDNFDGTNFDYEFKGKKYALTQQPYPASGTNYIHSGGVDYPQYTACCVDEDGDEYHMYWDVLDCWLDEDGNDSNECEDESSICDWENPSKVIKI